MNNSHKVLVQFDGNNFYNRAKNLASEIHLTEFDYLGLSQFLSQQKRLEIIYYIGLVRTEKENKKSIILRANQQKLFDHLRKQDVVIKLGFLLKIGDNYHEKGVDVQIAVDLVRGALKNEYDECYLISSDTDLLPAIKTAQQEGKKIIYVGFENFVSQALSRNCSSSLILTEEQIFQFATQRFDNKTLETYGN